ncbi:HigA family addiction module antitoxin [Undibacterium terreum]|nr:HigA family addiction module antitoxin [Undibacterium terreum]
MGSAISDDDFDSTGLIPPDARPGKILLEEFLIPLTRPKEQVADATGLGMATIDGILEGKIEINAEIGAALDSHFGVEPGYWLQLQRNYDNAIRLALSGDE